MRVARHAQLVYAVLFVAALCAWKAMEWLM
jgi:hypothetical protein